MGSQFKIPTLSQKRENWGTRRSFLLRRLRWRLILWLSGRYGIDILARRDIRNFRHVRYFTFYCIVHHNAGVLEQKAGSTVKFELSFFVGSFGRNQI